MDNDIIKEVLVIYSASPAIDLNGQSCAASRSQDNRITRRRKGFNNNRFIINRRRTIIINYIGSDNDKHKDVGAVVAKYLETLQRSNEQLVKLVTLIEKKSAENEGLTEKDKNEIFDLLTKTEAN